MGLSLLEIPHHANSEIFNCEIVSTFLWVYLFFNTIIFSDIGLPNSLSLHSLYLYVDSSLHLQSYWFPYHNKGRYKVLYTRTWLKGMKKGRSCIISLSSKIETSFWLLLLPLFFKRKENTKDHSSQFRLSGVLGEFIKKYFMDQIVRSNCWWKTVEHTWKCKGKH